jgi:predicted nuclease of predicted toxin-antitoxin system
MRFLVDECLTWRVAELLTEHGHDATHVAALGLLGRSDDMILAAAASSGRVVVSADTDFGELLQLTEAVAPSVVLLRRRSHEPNDQVTAVLAALADVEADLLGGAIVVIDEARIRVRTLPIGE